MSHETGNFTSVSQMASTTSAVNADGAKAPTAIAAISSVETGAPIEKSQPSGQSASDYRYTHPFGQQNHNVCCHYVSNHLSYFQPALPMQQTLAVFYASSVSSDNIFLPTLTQPFPTKVPAGVLEKNPQPLPETDFQFDPSNSSSLNKRLQKQFGLPEDFVVFNETTNILQAIKSINDHFYNYVELASIPTMINYVIPFVQNYSNLRSVCYIKYPFAYSKPQSVYDIVKLINSFYDTLCNLGLVHLINNDVLPKSSKTILRHTSILDKAMLVDAMYAPHKGKAKLKRPVCPPEHVSIADCIVLFLDQHFSIIDFFDHTKHNMKKFTENLEYASALGILTSIVRYCTFAARYTATDQLESLTNGIVNSLKGDYLTMFSGKNIFTFIRIGCILGNAEMFLKQPVNMYQLVDNSTRITRNHNLYLVRDTVDSTISSRCSLPRSQSCQCDQFYEIGTKRRHSDRSSPSQSVASGRNKEKKSFHNKKRKKTRR